MVILYGQPCFTGLSWELNVNSSLEHDIPGMVGLIDILVE